jgi:hypothetical protein
MMVITIVFMKMGIDNGINELLYLGFGLPLWFYLLIFYIKWINNLEVGSESVRIKNVIFGQKIIEYSEIEQWEEIYTVNLLAHNLLLKVRGKKIVISNMCDLKNYENLRHILKTDWTKSERKYI